MDKNGRVVRVVRSVEELLKGELARNAGLERAEVLAVVRIISEPSKRVRAGAQILTCMRLSLAFV